MIQIDHTKAALAGGGVLAVVAITFIVLNGIKLQQAKANAVNTNNDTSGVVGVTAATASTNQQLGTWNVSPTLNYSPYSPIGLRLYAVGDYKGDNLGSMSNVTLDTAAQQMPTSAVGFVFVVSDNSKVTASSIGTAFYKGLIDQQAVPEQTLFRFVGGDVKGNPKVEYLPGYAQQVNNIGTGTGTLRQAIDFALQNQMVAGFGWTPNVSTTVMSPQDSDVGIFQLKTSIRPTTVTDVFCFTYIRNSYIVPSHTWSPYSLNN